MPDPFVPQVPVVTFPSFPDVTVPPRVVIPLPDDDDNSPPTTRRNRGVAG